MKACQTHGNLWSPHSRAEEEDDAPCVIPQTDCEGIVDCITKSVTTKPENWSYKTQEGTRKLGRSSEWYKKFVCIHKNDIDPKEAFGYPMKVAFLVSIGEKASRRGCFTFFHFLDMFCGTISLAIINVWWHPPYPSISSFWSTRRDRVTLTMPAHTILIFLRCSSVANRLYLKTLENINTYQWVCVPPAFMLRKEDELSF